MIGVVLIWLFIFYEHSIKLNNVGGVSILAVRCSGSLRFVK
jgi:hypothetical protein